MNRKKTKSIKVVIISAAAFILLVMGSVAAFAGESLLSPSGTSVTAGSGLSFTVNLSDIKEEYSQTQQAFTLTVNISPSPEAVSVSPDVQISQCGSKYTATSADLENVSALTFTVYPGSSITTETSYTVSAAVSGSGSQPSDSFTFTATPASQPKDNPGKGNNKKMKGISVKGGSVSSAASSTDSSTTYQGSADNYLEKLSVDGYDFTEKFNSTRDTYFIEIPEDTESVDVNATAHDSSAVVRIAGNDSITEDKSKIMISVTADNGDVRVYRIFVTRSTEDK